MSIDGTGERIAGSIYKEVAVENIRIFSRRYFKSEPFGLGSASWNDTISFAESLNLRQRAALLEIIRQVSIDAASTVFSFVEGCGTLPGFSADFALTYDGQDIGQDIQTHFLNVDEASRQEGADGRA